MPETITVMYWNVQDLGTFSPWRRGNYYQPICTFIAGMAEQNNVDVFCLMESRKDFVPHIPTLVTALDDAFTAANKDANWFFDWIPGSIKGDLNTRFIEDDTPEQRAKRRRVSVYEDRESARITPTRFDQLDYSSTGHYEGYVILWNEDSTAFDIVSRASGPSGGVNTGLNGNHAAAKHVINLVYEGREIKGWIARQGVHATHYQLSASGFDPAHPGNTDWAKLDFSQRMEASGRWYAVRRAAYCTVSVANQASAADRYLPIMVFHAPSSEGSGAFGGTDRCGMSRQMYQTQQANNQWTTANRVVVGGDYNVSTQHEYEYVYATFTAALGAGDNAGAGCTQFVPSRTGTADADLSKSIVRVTKPDPQGGGYRNLIQILPPQGQNDSNGLYRSLAVDNIFTRGFSAAVPPKTNYQVYNLQVELQTYHSAVATLAKAALYNFIRNQTNGMARDADGNPVWFGTALFYTNILNYPQMMAQLNARQFTSPRRTAEFTNTFLSDHMPLIVAVTT
jgi:hypothetical protein